MATPEPQLSKTKLFVLITPVSCENPGVSKNGGESERSAGTHERTCVNADFQLNDEFGWILVFIPACQSLKHVGGKANDSVCVIVLQIIQHVSNDDIFVSCEGGKISSLLFFLKNEGWRDLTDCSKGSESAHCCQFVEMREERVQELHDVGWRKLSVERIEPLDHAHESRRRWDEVAKVRLLRRFLGLRKPLEDCHRNGAGEEPLRCVRIPTTRCLARGKPLDQKE